MDICSRKDPLGGSSQLVSIVSNPIFLQPFRRKGNNPNLEKQDAPEVAVFNVLFPLVMKCLLLHTLMYTVSSVNFTQSLPGTVSGRNPAHVDR